MAEVVTRKIGLSLGADICWPLCLRGDHEAARLAIPLGGRHRPLRGRARHRSSRSICASRASTTSSLDRLTHWYHTSREWIKKAILMDGLYVLNNPWAVQSMEKHTTYCAMMQLGMPIPETWMVPPKSYEPTPDLKPTLARYAKLFDLGDDRQRASATRCS